MCISTATFTMANGVMIREMEKVDFSIKSIGTLKCANKEVYNGQWKDDAKNGRGIFRKA